jgi:hypothetical protein
MYLSVLLHMTPASDDAICTVQLLTQNRAYFPQLECLFVNVKSFVWPITLSLFRESPPVHFVWDSIFLS